MDEEEIKQEEQKSDAQTVDAPEKSGEERRGLFTQAEVDELVKQRLERDRQVRQRELDEARKRAESEALARNAEWEKLARQREEELARLQAELKQRELNELRREIARKVGLPDVLAPRIAGETAEAMEEDAKSLLEGLPKPKTSQMTPNMPPNPQIKETETERIQRLYGQQYDPFAAGGGVVWTRDSKPD